MAREVLFRKMRLLRFRELRRVCPGTACRSPPSHILSLNMATGLLLCWFAQVLGSVINGSRLAFWSCRSHTASVVRTGTELASTRRVTRKRAEGSHHQPVTPAELGSEGRAAEDEGAASQELLLGIPWAVLSLLLLVKLCSNVLMTQGRRGRSLSTWAAYCRFGSEAGPGSSCRVESCFVPHCFGTADCCSQSRRRISLKCRRGAVLLLSLLA